MILFSHPTGNANVREAARALSDAGLLTEFWTSIYWPAGHSLNRFFPRSLKLQLSRRAFPHVSKDQVRSYPWVEVGRLLARELNISSLLRHEAGCFSIDAVYRSLDSKVAARIRTETNIQGVYAYEDGALATFRAARRLGIKTIYELPIGYWRSYREFMREEAALEPEWAITLQASHDSDEKLQRKDEELALATHIIVASEFVRSTLRKADHVGAPISIIPYGAPSESWLATERAERSRKLRVLFVGTLTQRKGVSYLLKAVAQLSSQVELTLVGRRVAECPALDRALRVHRWIPSLPHAALLKEMGRHDVMVFPSLFEGFALVLLEAMSQGLPVITTPHTAAPEFISEGQDGFVVPIRDPAAIVEKLELLLLDPHRLADMSHAARCKTAQHSWRRYHHRLANTVRAALREDLAGHSPMPQLHQLSECTTC